MSDYNQNTIENDEISLKDLILLIKKYFFVLLNKWWLIGIVALLFGAYFGYSSFTKTIEYNATLTYTSAEGNSAISGAMGLIGGFLGKGGRSNPLVKAQAMATTQKIGKEALFKKVYIDDTLDYLINHHARIYELEEFVPFTNDKLETREEREAFKDILEYITKVILQQSIDEETGIATMNVNTKSEEYSIGLAESYYKSLIEFYTLTEVGQQQKTLNALQSRADSLYSVIQGKVYGIARKKDQDKGIFWAVDKVPEAQASTELGFLTSAYEELVKNLETIKFTVSSNTPSIEVIDYPTTPLKTNKGGLIVRTIIGLFIGGFLASLYVLGRQILSDIMEEDDNSHLVAD